MTVNVEGSPALATDAGDHAGRVEGAAPWPRRRSPRCLDHSPACSPRTMCGSMVSSSARSPVLQATPEVPVAPYADGPHVMAVVRRALARARYDIELGE
jgi:hypothetical protein